MTVENQSTNIQCYKVLWIRNIDAICIRNVVIYGADTFNMIHVLFLENLFMEIRVLKETLRNIETEF